MDLEIWRTLISGLDFVLLGLLGAWLEYVRRSQVSRREHAEQMQAMDRRLIRAEGTLASGPSSDKCTQHLQRTALLEEGLKRTPGHEDIKRVHARIDQVSELASRIDGRLQGIERSLTVIQQYLLDNSRGD